MLFWQVFAALLCVAYSRNHAYKHSGCGRGFKQFDEVCLKTYHYATDYETANRKCRHQGSHLIRGTKKSLKKMVKNMQSKKMIENTKYWTSSYGLDENSVWFHRFAPKDFAIVMSINRKDLEERVESRSMVYRFICQKYLSHSKSKSKEQKEKYQDTVEKETVQHEQADTVIEINEILSEGEIINELGLIDDEPGKLTDSEAIERSSLQSSEESDLSSEASDLSSQQSSEESHFSSLQSSEESDLSSEASDLSSQQRSEESDLSSEANDLGSQQRSGESYLSSLQSSEEEGYLTEETKINSDQGLKEFEDEPEGRLSEEQWGEQIKVEHGAADLDHEEGLEDDKQDRTKETYENSSPASITAASFKLPFSFIVLCIVT